MSRQPEAAVLVRTPVNPSDGGSFAWCETLSSLGAGCQQQFNTVPWLCMCDGTPHGRSAEVEQEFVVESCDRIQRHCAHADVEVPFGLALTVHPAEGLQVTSGLSKTSAGLYGKQLDELDRRHRTCSTASTAASSTAVEEEEDCSSSIADQVLELVHDGRVSEAQRKLKNCCTATPGEITPELGERLDRIVGCFEQSLQELRLDASDGWVTSKINETCEFGYRFIGDDMQFTSITEYPGCGAARALAAFMEVDLSKGFKPTVSKAEMLRRRDALSGASGASSTDCIWRVHSGSMFGWQVYDDIIHVSAVDALDEPLGSLWVSLYGPAAVGAIEVCGVHLPAPDAGAVRSQGRATCSITPLRASGQSSLPGCRISMAVTVTAPPVARSMFTFALKACLRKGSEATVASFTAHVLDGQEFQRRYKDSERAAFYEHIEDRVAAHLGMPEPHQAGMSKVRSCSASSSTVSPTTSVAADSDINTESSCSDDEERGIHADFQNWPSWQEISRTFPLDWADHV